MWMHNSGDNYAQYVWTLAHNLQVPTSPVIDNGGWEPLLQALWLDSDTGTAIPQHQVCSALGMAEKAQIVLKKKLNSGNKFASYKEGVHDAIKDILSNASPPLSETDRNLYSKIIKKMVQRFYGYVCTLEELDAEDVCALEFLDADMYARELENQLKPVTIKKEAKRVQTQVKRWNAARGCRPTQTPVKPLDGDRLNCNSYKWLLDYYTSILENKADIHTGKIVTHISVSDMCGNEGEGHCQVVCSDGSLFTADCVVVTVPLGVLKANTITFAPDLTECKKNAIKRMGAGSHNKIILRFEKCFWDEEANFINCTHPIWQFMNLHAYGQTNCICAHAFGIYNWNGMTHEQVLEELISTMKTMFLKNGEALPNLLNHEISDWDTDPMSLMSYSFFAKDTDGTEPDVLAYPHLMTQPSDTHELSTHRVFFAGESTATCLTGLQCVHGAVYTGRRAAAECMCTLYHLCVPPWLTCVWEKEYWQNRYADTDINLKRIQEYKLHICKEHMAPLECKKDTCEKQHTHENETEMQA